MKQPILFLSVSLFLSACAAAMVTPTAAPTVAPSSMPIVTHTVPLPTPSATPIERYQVITWFLNPQPPAGERVMLFASLLQNGWALSSERMRATWPDENAPGGTAVCWDKPNYARGICYIHDTGQYPPGQPVTITVEMLWLGQWYSTQAAFTVQ